MEQPLDNSKIMWYNMSKRNVMTCKEVFIMDINERDYKFMLKIKSAFEKSQEGEVGSIRSVAKDFNLSRTKVRKILVTLGVIKSELTEKALALKKYGMGIEEIADELGCSMATVSTYLPYDTVIYNGEEKSPGAIRHEKYRERNKYAADKQVQRNKNLREEWEEDMKKREFKVIKLGLELNINCADMEVLRKYGKVKEGITREILVPADINLHSLHYVIQMAFGWQNCHLHHFKLPETIFSQLTQNSFIKWSDYCGIYFRFPKEDMEDLYWDDDYDESVSIKTWLRRKYTGLYCYRGISEHFMEARAAVNNFIKMNQKIRVSPSFYEWMNMSEAERENLKTNPRVKKITDVTCDEMRNYFAESGGIEELLERLRITEIMGEKTEDDKLKSMVSDANKRFEENDTHADNDYYYWQKMNKLDASALPLTNELIYEYDYGDGWEVRIKLLDEYYSDDAWDHPDKSGFIIPAITDEQVFDDQTPMYKNGEIIYGELRDQIATVIMKQRPLCIALDGLPVLDDIGGIGGYCEMLMSIHIKNSDHSEYENPEKIKEWARMRGWTGKLNTPEKLI